MAVYRSEVIRVPRLLQAKPIIEGDEFIECHIEGPAVLFPTGTRMVNCTTPDASVMIWEVTNLRNPVNLAGGVLVRDCTFTDCTFLNIGMAAPGKFLDDLKRGWGL